MVTGAACFIGADLTRCWLERNKRDIILVVDVIIQVGGLQDVSGVLSDRCSIVEFDINDIDTIKDIGTIKNQLRTQELTTIAHSDNLSEFVI